MGRLKRAIMTAAMVGGMLIPSGALARRHVCSGSIERGNMTFFMKKTRRSTIVNTPLLEDKHLRIKLPERYMRELRSASRKRSVPKDFVSAVIQSNVSIALGRLRHARKTRFYCAELKAPPPAPRPVVRPSPRPVIRPALRRPPARPDDGGRGRMIFIGETGDSAPTYSHPIRPYSNGGAGTRGSPYKIRIPVPSQKRNGTVLYREVLPARAGPITAYFNLRFISRQGVTRTTTRRKLKKAIVSVIENKLRTRLRDAGIKYSSVFGLEKKVRPIVGRALNSPDIRRYAK